MRIGGRGGCSKKSVCPEWLHGSLCICSNCPKILFFFFFLCSCFIKYFSGIANSVTLIRLTLLFADAILSKTLMYKILGHLTYLFFPHHSLDIYSILQVTLPYLP